MNVCSCIMRRESRDPEKLVVGVNETRTYRDGRGQPKRPCARRRHCVGDGLCVCVG